MRNDDTDSESSHSSLSSILSVSQSGSDDHRGALDELTLHHGHKKVNSCALDRQIERSSGCRPHIHALLTAHAHLMAPYSGLATEQLWSVDWSNIHAVVKRFVGNLNQKSIAKELRYLVSNEAQKTFASSTARLLHNIDRLFNYEAHKDDEDTNWHRVGKIIASKTYEQSLVGPQVKELHAVKQMWRKHFRGSAKANPAARYFHQRLELCYESAVLSIGKDAMLWEIVLCAQSPIMPYATDSIKRLLASRSTDLSTEVELCGATAEDWRKLFTAFTKLDHGSCRRISVAQGHSTDLFAQPGLVPPAIALWRIDKSAWRGRDEGPRVELPSSDLALCSRTVTAAVLQGVLRRSQRSGIELSRAARIPSLLSLAALAARDAGVDIAEVPTHLTVLIASLYHCVSCKRLVASQSKLSRGFAGSQKFGQEAVLAGFNTDNLQREELQHSLAAGDAWLPPLSEAVFQIRPDQFHNWLCPATRGGQWQSFLVPHDPAIRERQTLAFYFMGGRGTGPVRGEHDAGGSIACDPDWQFCAACAAAHLCAPLASPPACGCLVCAFEARVHDGQEEAHFWRRVHDAQENWPRKHASAPIRNSFMSEQPASVNRATVALACPLCAAASNSGHSEPHPIAA